MEKNKIEIYSPRFEGDRFKEHRLPLDLLEDLTTLQEMTIEMAKYIYLENNPDRKRIPKNFTSGISFELENIGPGSTIPKIVLVTSMIGLFPHPNTNYFQQAKEKIIQAVQSAEEETIVNQIVPDNVLNYFNRFGRKLREEEYIEFNPTGENKAKFTKDTRKRLILASSKAKEYLEEVSMRGYISEMDQAKKTFHIERLTGQRIDSIYNENFEDVLKDAFIGYTHKNKVLIKGTGKFNKSEKLVKIETLEEIIPLDDLDVPFRLEEISQLRDGWLNGEGQALDANGLNWLSENFENNYDFDLLLPHIFPTSEGGILMEWSINSWELSLAIDLQQKTALLQSVNVETDDDNELNLNLNEDKDWIKLNNELKNIFKA